MKWPILLAASCVSTLACSDATGPEGLELGTYTAEFTGDITEEVTGVALLRRDLGLQSETVTTRADLLELNVAPPKASLSVQVSILFIDQPPGDGEVFELTDITDGLPERGVVAIVELQTANGTMATMFASGGTVTIQRLEQIEAQGTVEFNAVLAQVLEQTSEFQSIAMTASFRARIS